MDHNIFQHIFLTKQFTRKNLQKVICIRVTYKFNKEKEK